MLRRSRKLAAKSFPTIMAITSTFAIVVSTGKRWSCRSDQLASQWASWLIEKGMETVIVDPPANTKGPTVRYRMPTTKKLHIHDPDKAKEMVMTLQLIGVYVSTSNHGNHIDASVHCPQWKTIELTSDEIAHKWQKWLNDNGFETQHTH